jgi:hypothetical protein
MLAELGTRNVDACLPACLLTSTPGPLSPIICRLMSEWVASTTESNSAASPPTATTLTGPRGPKLSMDWIGVAVRTAGSPASSSRDRAGDQAQGLRVPCDALLS